MDSIDIWKIIFDFCDFKSKLTLISVNNFLRKNLVITDLFWIDTKNTKLLTNDVIKLHIFSKVTKLYACNNQNITDVSPLKYLRVLHAHGSCGIGQKDIEKLESVGLYGLFAGENEKIVNVSMIKTLKALHAYGKCGIDQKGIEGLELIVLFKTGNKKIKSDNILPIDHLFSFL